MSRFVQVIFALLIIIAAGFAIFSTNEQSAQQNPAATTTDPTSTEQTSIPESWEVYENAQLDVAFQHPPEATVQTEGPENRNIKVTYLGSDNATGEISDGFTVTISSFTKSSEDSLSTFVKDRVADNTPAQSTSEVATTTFRNQTAFRYRTETIGTVTHTVFAPSPDRAVDISSNITDPSDNGYQQLVDQISTDFSEITGGDSEPAGTVSEVTLVMLNQDVPANQEPERGCDLLAPITRSIKPTQAPLTAAMEELFAFDQTNVQEFYNFIANTNDTLRFDRATVENGTASIYLTGELSGLSGVCDNPRASIQINQTAKQFSTVEDVQIYLNGQQTDLTPSGRQ